SSDVCSSDLVRRAVVAQHPLDPDPAAREERAGAAQKAGGLAPAQGRTELAKGQAAGHVDGDMQMTPAHPPMRVRHGLAGPAAAPFDAAEALDVDKIGRAHV